MKELNLMLLLFIITWILCALFYLPIIYVVCTSGLEFKYTGLYFWSLLLLLSSNHSVYIQLKYGEKI